MKSTQRVTISRGNRKLGALMNVSLAPIECCPPGIPCAKEGCYALKAYRLYPATRRAWSQNGRIARTNLESYFSQIEQDVSKNRPEYFRWHVAGDILNTGYLQGMCEIAECSPSTSFLAFTKAFSLINEYEKGRELARNLTIVFSGWPGMHINNPYNHRIAWMQNGRELRVPRTAVECLGNCHDCRMCFHLQKLGRDVVFHQH